MSVVRTLALAGVAAQLAGCFVFSMPPSVPKVNRPNLAPDTFLEANSGIVREAFIGLEYLPGETPGYAVSLLVGDTEQRFVDIDVESAYARAVLALLRG